ncbi:MAG: Tm-1-like ATP-binding domain-containing protein [Thermomicrobiales bacterium]|nr:Tm-1-like ATP-binding domain-containing protein [Thermomicrobiales bacterium]
MPTVVLLGTLDTKGEEYAFVRGLLQDRGLDVLLVDAGILGEPKVAPDIARDAVAAAAGHDIAALAAAGDRGVAVAAMAAGAAEIVGKLSAEGQLDAIMGLGGSGGSTVIAAAMRALPIGVPKLLVSTVAAGDTRPYVDTADIMLLPSVVDISGINPISERILRNAAAAIGGMAVEFALFAPEEPDRPLVAATMFGVTTPCVTHLREVLDDRGYETLVFHATGTGGRAMERLLADGYLTGVLDVTTTELADELVGGVLSAGPDRLEAAGALGLPQVVSLGALDMVNFGPRETAPERFAGRQFYVHNPTVTLMRTTPAENAELGAIIARKLNAATGPLALFIPLRGVSAIAGEGQVFHHPAADAALLGALREHLRPEVEVHELDLHINDPAFAEAMARRFDELYQDWRGQERSQT